MMRLLFIFLLALPVIEIWLFVEVGRLVGALPEILLVIASAILGVILIRHQGFAVVHRLRVAASRGEPLALPMLESIALLVAGLLLIVPGFLTDLLAILLLLPPLRRALVYAFLLRPLARRRGAFRVIEGEFRREDDPKK